MVTLMNLLAESNKKKTRKDRFDVGGLKRMMLWHRLPFSVSKPKQPIYFNESRKIFFAAINLSVDRMQKKEYWNRAKVWIVYCSFLVFHSYGSFMIVIEHIFSVKCSSLNNNEKKRKKKTNNRSRPFTKRSNL